MEQNEYMMGNVFPGNDAASLEVQDRMEIKSLLRTGNALRIAILVNVVLFGVVSLALLIFNVVNTGLTREDVNRASSALNSISREVSTIAGDVYDIMEQGCSGGNTGIIDPDPDDPFDPYGQHNYEYEVEKPAIYLYPENDNEEIQVKLSLYRTDMLSMWPEADYTYAYEYYWNVRADKNGTIRDQKDDEYSYIFWEAADHGIHDFSKGFCVAGEDTAQFLKDTLSEIGLSSKEYNDFIGYWLPRMEDNAYNLITFEGLEEGDAYNSFYGLEVTDSDGNAADSVLRVLMVWKPADAYTDVEPQTFTGFERNGFTVVEWGGAEVDD